MIIAHSSYLHLPLCRFLIDWRQLDRIKSSSKRVCDKFLNKIRRQYLIRRKLICPLDTLDIILCVLRLAWFAKWQRGEKKMSGKETTTGTMIDAPKGTMLFVLRCAFDWSNDSLCHMLTPLSHIEYSYSNNRQFLFCWLTLATVCNMRNSSGSNANSKWIYGI